MNHRWNNDKCTRCGIEREKREFKQIIRIIPVIRNGVWEDKNIYKRGIGWHYGKEHKFNRPECKR